MDVNHLFRPEKIAVCRPALPKDTRAVLELTRWIWDGHDYVPEAWPAWLADPFGRLAVVEYGGRVAGLFKLTRLGPDDWWMEGLRVHPELEGHGLASRLFDYLVQYWLENESGVLRLATASYRRSVQHLSERTGFRKVGEFTSFQAEALPEPVDGFQPLAPEAVPQALELLQGCTGLALSWGLIDLVWTWSHTIAAPLQAAAEHSHAWWWRGRKGLLAFDEDSEHGQPLPSLMFLGCPLEQAGEYLLDFRRLAAACGYGSSQWSAPLRPDVEALLPAAGFQRSWDASVFVYERFHPGGT